MGRLAPFCCFFLLIWSTAEASAQSPRDRPRVEVVQVHSRAVVSSGPNAAKENTSLNRARCVLKLARQVLNQSALSNLVITSVRRSKFNHVDFTYLLDARDRLGNPYEGWLIAGFTAHVGGTSKAKNAEERVDCMLLAFPPYSRSVAFRLKNAGGDPLVEVHGE